MARYRLSGPAKADIASILRTSEAKHGRDAHIRYPGLLTAALRRIAEAPDGVSTADRSEIFEGLRSHHIRHSRTQSREEPVAGPVHVIFFRASQPDHLSISRPVRMRAGKRRYPSCAITGPESAGKQPFFLRAVRLSSEPAG